MPLEASLRIIIPTRNELPYIGPTLVSVVHSAPEARIVVADGGSTDGTVGFVRRFPGVELITDLPACRAVQCNIAVRGGADEILLFLHADTILTRAGVVEMLAAMRQSNVAGGSFRFAFSDAVGRYRVTAWGANLRSRWMRLPFGDQGIFCRRAAFERIGGFPELPLMDDVAFIRRLRRIGRFVLLRSPVYTSARRVRQHGVVKSGMRNWGLLTAYRLGISPRHLATWYGTDPDNTPR